MNFLSKKKVVISKNPKLLSSKVKQEKNWLTC